jgi:hypothetical protein
MEMNMHALKLSVLVVSLAIGTMARAEDIAPPPEATAPIFLIKADSKAMADKLSALQLAVQETLRLKDVCGASDLRLCQPEPPCDAQGQRPKPWQGCILAWGTNENGKEALTWVDEWQVDNANLGYRRPVLGADGKLY